ncbi:p21-activated protein kinase-interacting protein 1-like [Prorops nasuta]|uniref:p21-activated protein kinase-interacting protein 1-like n=1 Tax=Prorops nasuta TaxID=863751 RepID=UPI0034CF0B16
MATITMDNRMNDFEIIVGTYEQYLLGYKVNDIVNEYKMEKSFAIHTHVASIRSVDNKKHYVASGGADDSVYLYDMKQRIQSGCLMHHNDTVNALAFTPDATHLFTCSSDGTIAAIRCGNWQTEMHLQKPHKGLAVNAFAIHPTGNIALSTGADGVLRTWNLIKGRQAYATNLVPRLKLDAKNVTVLRWSPNGEKYLLAVNHKIDVYSVALAGIDNEINFESKVVCVEFLKDDLLAVGLDNGQVKFYDLEKSAETVDIIAHDIRVKCIAHKNDLLVTASSSGEIKLWRFTKNKLSMLHSVNCGARITCLSLANIYSNVKSTKPDIKLEDEVVKKNNKFRLKQEVIIEHEDDEWSVSPIKKSDLPKTKKTKKNARTSEEIESEIVQHSKKKKVKEDKRNVSEIKREREQSLENSEQLNPKKKRKLKAKKITVSPKKRKDGDIDVNNDSGLPVKKKKKIANSAPIKNKMKQRVQAKSPNEGEIESEGFRKNKRKKTKS